MAGRPSGWALPRILVNVNLCQRFHLSRRVNNVLSTGSRRLPTDLVRDLETDTFRIRPQKVSYKEHSEPIYFQVIRKDCDNWNVNRVYGHNPLSVHFLLPTYRPN